jgi:hypothetical protein
MLLALLGACSSTDRQDSASDAASVDCESAAPTAVIGTGEYAWEALAPGDEITMVHGPQGGWHILGSVRLDAMYENVEIRYTITDVPSGHVVSDNDYFVQQVPLDGCQGEVIGRYGYLSDYDELVSGESDTPWELLACHEVTLAMSIVDRTWKKSVETSLTAIAVPDPADSTEPCP